MLLDNEVSIKRKNNSNLDYYKSLGYEVHLDEFKVQVKDILKNSSIRVKVSCDYCGKIEEIPFIKWNRSMQSIVKKYACSNVCKGEKTKESNLVNYGVTSVAKLESSKEKSKITCLETYGVDTAFKSDVVKQKIKESNLEKWGVDCVLKNKDVREKVKNTIIEKWGVDNISKSTTIKEKKKRTTLSNWGVEIPLHSDEIKEKVKKTNLEKYGNNYFTKTDSYRKENYDIANDPFYLEYIDNGISLFKCDCGKDHDFKISKDVYSKRKVYNVSLCTICNVVGENKSIKEKDLYNFISSIYKNEIIKTYRDGRMEIDIYLPELKIGFEFNGLYWHSDEYKDSKFHIKKTEFFKEKGIRLVHIWEDDWDFKCEIIKSQIFNLLSLNKNRIFARKCEVKFIDDVKSVKTFLMENHIQGYVNSDIKIGLFYEGRLVSLMSFDKFEGRKKMSDNEWNLNRFCNLKGYSIVGGASKLFKFFLDNFNPKRIISYADRDWSIGDIYYKLGFELSSITGPDYKYIVNSKRIHKSRYRKSRTGITESKLNFIKIWDCGKIKFSYST